MQRDQYGRYERPTNRGQFRQSGRNREQDQGREYEPNRWNRSRERFGRGREMDNDLESGYRGDSNQRYAGGDWNPESRGGGGDYASYDRQQYGAPGGYSDRDEYRRNDEGREFSSGTRLRGSGYGASQWPRYAEPGGGGYVEPNSGYYEQDREGGRFEDLGPASRQYRSTMNPYSQGGRGWNERPFGEESGRYGSSGGFAGQGWQTGSYNDPGMGQGGYGGSRPYGGQEFGNQGYGQGYGNQGSGSLGQQGRPIGEHWGKGPKGYQRADERIQEDISERFTNEAQLDASEIEVRVNKGEVTLTGSVDNRQEKRLAEDIAESVSGVKDVTNNIRCRSNAHTSSNSKSQGEAGARKSPETETAGARR